MAGNEIDIPKLMGELTEAGDPWIYTPYETPTQLRDLCRRAALAIGHLQQANNGNLQLHMMAWAKLEELARTLKANGQSQ